ncbi:hypothetical protein GCM10007937_25990 [Mesorhizobium albiziae]|nr:hypothetical protein GCM10007937_25990 [Mesorhizobium albiziae]
MGSGSARLAQVLLKALLPGLSRLLSRYRVLHLPPSCYIGWVKFVQVHASLTSTDQLSNLLGQTFKKLTRSAVPERVGLIFCAPIALPRRSPPLPARQLRLAKSVEGLRSRW